MNLLRLGLPFFCLLFPSHALASDAPLERAPLLMNLGEQRLLKLPGLQRFSLGSPLIKAIPLPAGLRRKDPDTLLLKGVANGVTDLWVWKKDGSSEHRMVQVLRATRLEIPASLARALAGLSEAEILYSGSIVCLRGEIQTRAEAERIASLITVFPTQVRDETDPAEALLRDAVSRLEGKIRSRGWEDHLRVERVASSVWVRGSLERRADEAPIARSLRDEYPLVQLELRSISDSAPTVHFRVFLLELKRTRFSSLGLTWPAVQESAFRVTTSAIQDMLQLDLTLQALESEGSIRVLSNPELVVRAPGEAELFAGGELPIHMVSRFYDNVTWKTYGLTLKLKVAETAGDRVRLDISSEVSHLDPSIALDKVPGLQTNRMKTQVDARYGVPLFLSGLLQQDVRENARGLPYLRRIPILGELFGSEDYQNERSELVAILLPSATPPEAPMQKVQPVPDIPDWAPESAPATTIDPSPKEEEYPLPSFATRVRGFR